MHTPPCRPADTSWSYSSVRMNKKWDIWRHKTRPCHNMYNIYDYFPFHLHHTPSLSTQPWLKMLLIKFPFQMTKCETHGVGEDFFSWYGNLKQIYHFVNKMLRPVINWRSLEIARWLISPSSANAKVLTLSLVVLRVKIKSVPLLNFSVTLCHFFPMWHVFPKRQKPS